MCYLGWRGAARGRGEGREVEGEAEGENGAKMLPRKGQMLPGKGQLNVDRSHWSEHLHYLSVNYQYNFPKLPGSGANL